MERQTIIDECKDSTLFAWSPQAAINPIVAAKGEGTYFWDVNGDKYLDLSSQLVCVNIGHGDKRVAAAVQAQMEQISFVFPGTVTEVRAEVGRRLATVSPQGMTKTFFTLGGADAVENSIKLARVYSGRTKILGLYKAYHGSTYATMTAAGDPRRHAIDSLAAPGFVHAENPYFYRCPWYSETPEQCTERAIAHLRRILTHENPESFAAILLEGVSGSSGGIMYPPGYMKAVRKLCDEFGILLIADEVMSGFGRTGHWFGIDHWGVTPDIIATAKGLSGGYAPLGAVIVQDKIAQHFNDRPLPIGLTYSAHPVSLAAANAVLAIYESENLVQQAAKRGEYLQQAMNGLQTKHPSLGDYRRVGLLGVLELVRNRATKEPLTAWNASGSAAEATGAVQAAMRKNGLFSLMRWSWLFTAPPLTISEVEIDDATERLDAVLTVADQYYTG